MTLRTGIAAILTSTLVLASCSDSGLEAAKQASVAPQLAAAAAAMPAVRFSEIHYDNSGTDTGEAIEISGPAGTDITGWSIVLYNLTGGAVYNTRVLAGTIPATCDTRGVIVANYPTDGIQNGGQDGFALVNAAGSVVEFLSYEGVVTATNGPAIGMTSTDIGVSEPSTTPIGHSLARTGNGTWNAPAANTFGACNDTSAEPPPPPAVVATVTVTPSTATIVQGASQQFLASASDASNQPIAGVTFTWSTDAPAVASVSSTGLATGLAPGDARIIATAPNGVADTAALHVDAPPPPSGLSPVRFSEIHYDNVGTDANEAIEIEGPAGTSLAGWTIVLYNLTGGAVYSTQALTGTIPATCGDRGVLVKAYPADAGIQNGPNDGFALVNAAGTVVEFLSYEGVLTATNGPAAGMTSTDIGVDEDPAPAAGQSLQRNADGAWSGPMTATMGACNSGGDVPPPASSITFTGRSPSDVPLPAGFQAQVFATLRNGSGTEVPTTFVWSSDSPTIASVDQDGVFTALSAGTAVLRATAADGTTGSYSLPTQVATSSTTARYEGNAEFGEPRDANASDDFIIRRPQYTASYNGTLGTPNWVSYNLEATHFGDADRCNCFTADPQLPASFASYTTADYTGAGAFHGYRIDRGHLARSFDRTSGSFDNATTFYFSNIIPQAAELNQGPWADMENDLGNLARSQNREVYIITGPAGSKGTVKNEGKINIPASVWKVAVIMPRDQGLENIDDISDFEVIAVIAPNVAPASGTTWESWKTTVDAVEALSGYDLLALLSDQIEIAAESNTKPPTAATDGPYTGAEGASISMSAGSSTDPDAGDVLTYRWTFGDGGTANGMSVSHTYAQNGSYTVRLIATDSRGLVDTAVTTAVVSNVAPTISAFSGATVAPRQAYTASGSFTDPGADSWTATVDYGDGSGVQPLDLTDKSFTLSHTYETPGSYTVTVRISDGDATSLRTATVTVLTPAQLITNAIALVRETMDGGNANAIVAHLNAARNSLTKTNATPVMMQLSAVIQQLDVLERTGRMTAAETAPLRTAIARIMTALAS